MKRLLLTCIISLVGISCKKDQPKAENHSLTGSWRFVYAFGGIAGQRVNASAGDVRLLQLNADNTYVRLQNKQVMSQGKYYTDTKNSGGLNVTAIHYDTSSLWEFISVKNDSLFTSDPFPDGFQTVYVLERR